MAKLSHSYMTSGKTIALTRWIFVSKVMSLLLNTLSRFVIDFLPRSKHLLISWLESPSAVILKPKMKYMAKNDNIFLTFINYHGHDEVERGERVKQLA